MAVTKNSDLLDMLCAFSSADLVWLRLGFGDGFRYGVKGVRLKSSKADIYFLPFISFPVCTGFGTPCDFVVARGFIGC